jgi:hypothetical protein
VSNQVLGWGSSPTAHEHKEVERESGNMEGYLNIHEATSKRHSIGQMLKRLAPTQSPDVYKQYFLQISDHRYVQNSKVGFRASNKRHAHGPVHSEQNPPKKARLKPSDTTQRNTEKPSLKHLQDMTCTPNKNRCDLKGTQ